MNTVTDEDLILLYYGEHEDPSLAGRVADNDELNQRFRQLSAEMALADQYRPPSRNADYGAEVWQKIESRLGPVKQSSAGTASWWSGLLQPRFSMAGIFGLAVVAVLAFMLGRNGVTPMSAPQQAPQLVTLSGFDSERLLAASVSGHLDQLNVGLTEFAHGDNGADSDSDWATDMLVANRLYRQAAAASGDTRLNNFLAGLEPLLIELAYEAHKSSDTARTRMKEELSDGLLFRIRVMKQQLGNSPVKT